MVDAAEQAALGKDMWRCWKLALQTIRSLTLSRLLTTHQIKRKQFSVVASTGKSKDAIGVPTDA